MLILWVGSAWLVGTVVSGQSASPPEGPVVVRFYIRDRAHLDAVAGQLDIWEVHYDRGYAIAAVSPEQFVRLQDLGYRPEVDAARTSQMTAPAAALDPRFYYFDDYYPNANGRYVVDFLQDIAATYPTLTELFDIGDAWLAGQAGEHDRDIWVLRITNEDPAFGDIAEKPAFFLFATIHAREVAVPELAIRYIKYLTEGYNGQGGYGKDPDVTWLVDWNVVYVEVMQNPDGHWKNEQNTGNYRRKNMDNDDGCTDPNYWGVDLNRNSSFKWGCCGGSSGSPCDETYRGPGRASEPETQAFQTFFSQVMKDQNGPNGDDELPSAAPITTTGIFISLHSYSDLVLWPYGFAAHTAPNEDQLRTIGRKFAYYNGYDPTGDIYTVDGATDDWTYGKFGIASFTFEVGEYGYNAQWCQGFFPAYGCLDGIDGRPRSFWDENRPAFLYAHKIARTPYKTAYGPDATDLSVTPGQVMPGGSVQLQAVVADHRCCGDTNRPIAAAEYFVDAPGADGTGIPMSPADGSWGALSETVLATVDTSGLSLGRHYLLVHGQNDNGDWGPFTAVFITVTAPPDSRVVGVVRDSDQNKPVNQARVTLFNESSEYNATTGPDGAFSFLVYSGTYTLTAAAFGYYPATLPHIAARSGLTTTQDITLTVRPLDLQLTKTALPDPVFPGSPLTYTLNLYNNSIITATGLIISDVLPLQTAFAWSSGGGQFTGGSVIWHAPTLDPRATLRLTWLVTVSQNASGTIVNADYAASADQLSEPVSGPPLSVAVYRSPTPTPTRTPTPTPTFTPTPTPRPPVYDIYLPLIYRGGSETHRENPPAPLGWNGTPAIAGLGFTATARKPQVTLPEDMQRDKVSPWVLRDLEDGSLRDFLVVLTEQADLSPAYRLPTKQAKGRFVYETLWKTAQRSQAPLRAWLDARGVPYRSYYIVNLIHVQSGDPALVAALSARADVARIEANPRIYNPLPLPPETAAISAPGGIEWNIAHVGAPDVWAMGYTGQGIVVGGQDTGYDWDHPALKKQYRGWDGSGADHDYNWHDAIHSGGGVCGADSPEPCDDYGHGTHTMGTVLGDDGGVNQIGMAPGARWIGCRNMDQGYGTPATYLECFEFFLAPYPVGGDPGQGDPDKAPDVTNNSWGCPPSEGCSWSTLQAAVEAQRAAGIMTVVSAGNSGSWCSTVEDPPAIYDAAYTVGATDSADEIASFSSRGPVTVDGSNRLKPDISAPGVNIRSSVPGGGYQGGWSGTSMAGPHVAGAVALLWSARPSLRNQITETEEILNLTAVERYSTQCGDAANTVPNNVYGWGRLDVQSAVLHALSGGLAGTIRDEKGGAITGAKVEATLAPGQSWATTSGGDGRYSLSVLSGTLTVAASAPGYTSYVTTGITVMAGSTTTLNITLTELHTISGYVRDATTSRPLSATVVLSGSSLTSVRTDPKTGFYRLIAPGGNYTLRAETLHYVPQSRPITLDGDRSENFALEPYCLLVVADDGGDGFETYYTDALDRLGLSYNLTTSATLDWLIPYQGVIWLTGNRIGDTLTAADRSNLAAYLDGGGRLFLSGQNIGADIGDTDFYGSYLHAAFNSDDTDSYDLTGLDFMTGLDVSIQGGDGADNQTSPDDVEAVNGGTAIYDYAAPHLYGGVAFSDTYRTVYYAFGYEAINSWSDRDAVLSTTLEYLGVCDAAALQPPQAGFISSSPDVWRETTAFTNTSRGMPWMTYLWDFGDGTPPRSDVHPTHAYARPGTYTVTLTATNPYGSDTYSATVQIAAGCTPVQGVAFTYSPPDPTVETTLTFTGTEVSGTQPITYTWSFGDGATAQGATVTHTFTLPASYTVRLTATNCWGVTDTVSQTVAVAGVYRRYLPLILKDH